MSVFRICAAATLIVLVLSVTGNRQRRKALCTDIDIEMITSQSQGCTEDILRVGSVPVLIKQICKESPNFQNSKVPSEITFEAETDFFDTQQALATNVLWGVEPQPFNVSLRYLFNFSHERYWFFLYINGTLISMYNGSTVLYCDLNATARGDLTDVKEYVKGRGIDKLKSRSSELRTKWQTICLSLGVQANFTTETDILKCVSRPEPTVPPFTDPSSTWPGSTESPENENGYLNNEHLCGLLPVVGIVAIVSVTLIAVAVLFVIRTRLGSIENRYHRELSKYWL